MQKPSCWDLGIYSARTECARRKNPSDVCGEQRKCVQETRCMQFCSHDCTRFSAATEIISTYLACPASDKVLCRGWTHQAARLERNNNASERENLLTLTLASTLWVMPSKELSLSVGGGGAVAKYTAHLHTARTHSAILLVAENVINYPPRAAPSSSLHCAARGARPILNPPSRVAALRI
jgi:hypothetical protein